MSSDERTSDKNIIDFVSFPYRIWFASVERWSFVCEETRNTNDLYPVDEFIWYFFLETENISH